MPGGGAALVLAVVSPLCFILANLYLLLAEPAHGAARLLFLCGVVAAGGALQRLYRRFLAAREPTRLLQKEPSAAAQAAAAKLMRALLVFLGLACVLVGSVSLAPGGPPAHVAPPPPPPPPPLLWKQAGAAGSGKLALATYKADASSRGTREIKTTVYSRAKTAKSHTHKVKTAKVKVAKAAKAEVKQGHVKKSRKSKDPHPAAASGGA